MDVDEPSLHDVFTFLHHALLPQTAPARPWERFDIALERFGIQLDGRRHVRILDLGCSDAILLKTMKSDHARHHRGKFHYVGIDHFDIDDNPECQRVLEDGCSTCFPNPIYRDHDILQEDGIAETLRKHGPFEYIVLSNLLHELRLSKALPLLGRLKRHLTSDGKLIIADPDWKWSISDKAWQPKGERRLSNLPVEWETDAVWFAVEGILDLLGALGFDASTFRFPRLSMDIWVASASHAAATGNVGQRPARNAVCRHLIEQLASEVPRIRDLRRNLKSQFRDHRSFSGELLIRTMEFVAACVSQCKRLESIVELKGPS